MTTLNRSYANPHAATRVGGVTHTYDEDGNLLDDGTTQFTWNYRGELSSTDTPSATPASYTYFYG